MQQLKKWLSAITLCFAALVSQPLLAGQFVVHDNYEIHYNAFYSTFIQPDVAQAIGIQRSKRRALINVSVLKLENGEKKAVSAIVKGKATNLIQQSQTLKFQKVDEGKAIYYIGQFGFTDDQVLRLALEVQPDPNKPAYKINFEQRFYEE